MNIKNNNKAKFFNQFKKKFKYTYNKLICYQQFYSYFQVEMDGLTGKVKFDSQGKRTDFELEIVELKKDGLQKVCKIFKIIKFLVNLYIFVQLFRVVKLVLNAYQRLQYRIFIYL